MGPSNKNEEPGRRWRQSGQNERTFLLEGLPKRARCAEIGVWMGEFSEQILERTQPKELHLIDPWAYVPSFPRRCYGGLAAKSQADMDAIHREVVKRFQAIETVFVHRMPSVAAAESFDDGAFDWVYIDGDHSYGAVMQDLEAWLPKVKAGGLVTGDDVNWPGEDGSRPVRRALQDFAIERQIKKVIIKNNQFTIRRESADA